MSKKLTKETHFRNKQKKKNSGGRGGGARNEALITVLCRGGAAHTESKKTEGNLLRSRVGGGKRGIIFNFKMDLKNNWGPTYDRGMWEDCL